MKSNELILVHHRVKGQKLGIRRYQNEYGSLTAAGIGGGANFGQKTRQATILFDTENNLKEKSTRRITTEKHLRANDSYNKWRNKTNQYSSLRYSL